ncbi:hypothetical protein ACWGH8_20760 [Nonomuraea muscovyensis]
MTRRLVLVSLAAGALTVPAPASSAATGHTLTSSAPSGLASATTTMTTATTATTTATTATTTATTTVTRSGGTAPAPTELAIREILVRPADPVVGPGNSIRLVIDVIAKGAQGKEGVTVQVEPGEPPQLAVDSGAAPPDTAQPRPPAVPAPGPSTLPAQVEPGDPALVRPAPTTSIPVQHVPSRPRATTLPAIGPAPFPHGSGPMVKAVTGRPGKAVGAVGKAPGGPLGGRPSGRRPSTEWPLSRWPVRPGRAHVPAHVPGGRSDRQGEMGPAAWPNHATRLATPTGPATSAATSAATRAVTGGATGGAALSRGRAEGWETWRFLPDKGLNRFYPAGTWTITATARNAAGASVTKTTTFQLRRETRLASVRFGESQGSSHVRLSGVLTRVGPRGHADYAPYAEQPVEILWRADSSGAWEKVAATETGEAGAFTRTVRGHAGGQWRVRFAGTEDYAPALSRVYDMGGHRG